MGEPVGDETVDDAEGIAELVVEAGSHHAGRQGMAHVSDTLADMIPNVRHVSRRRAALQIDEDRGRAGASEAAQEVEAWGLLERLFEAVCYLIERLIKRCPRPARLHHHGAEGKRRILVAAEAVIR